ncbi:CatA-like O-acetyltransferase [Agromyces sp. M3QZ16-3]|uniref:CatA-like O-acetyltransferase n=1 Tax=Agromyces sp. M3QZ16-3 TaxID=3447585 RepID=UPI003F6922E9
MHRAFTVFNPARETFAAVWTPYDADFAAFHDRASAVVADAASADTMFPQGELPPDVFDVSSVPWTSFTGFTLQIDGGTRHLLPIFTIGRYVERDGRTLMPLAVRVHHASADGFHTARLVEDIRRLMTEPGWIGCRHRRGSWVVSGRQPSSPAWVRVAATRTTRCSDNLAA